MKRSNLIIKSLVLLAIMGLFALTGCNKDKTSTTNPTPTSSDYTAATDNSEAEISSNDVLNVSDAVVNDFKLGKSLGDTITFKWYGVKITRIKLGTGKREFIIDFGSKDTTTFGSRARKGQIILFVTGRYYYKGFEDSILFNNYYVNDKEIQGWHVVKNIGLQSGNITWTINANLTITRPGGATHTWISSRERELLNVALNDTTQNLWSTNLPYVYQITGSANGVNSKGVAYTANITIPLIKAFDCWWIEQGAIVFKVTGGYPVTLDYGNGTCDDNATVTVNGKTTNITLP